VTISARLIDGGFHRVVTLRYALYPPTANADAVGPCSNVLHLTHFAARSATRGKGSEASRQTQSETNVFHPPYLNYNTGLLPATNASASGRRPLATMDFCNLRWKIRRYRRISPLCFRTAEAMQAMTRIISLICAMGLTVAGAVLLYLELASPHRHAPVSGKIMACAILMFAVGLAWLWSDIKNWSSK
jgi:hypothetical protein